MEKLNTRRRYQIYETNLKRIRKAFGCSQSELARMSGVSLRSIQMYEQRNKDINKAQAETVLRLAKTLGCRMEDLYEITVLQVRDPGKKKVEMTTVG